MSKAGRTIPESLVPYLESGISVMVGTRDASLRPTAMRAAGARVRPDGRTIEVFLPLATGERTIADVRTTGRAAVSFSRPIDHLSVQVKGPARVRDADAADEATVLRYRAAFAESLEIIGLPRTLVARMTVAPAAVLEVDVEAIFTQTPGPTAGTPFGGTS